MELLSLTWFLSVFTILLISLSVSWLVFRKLEFHVQKIPPGPIGLPLLGYALFLRKDIHKELARLNSIYGKICSFTVASIRIITVSDYDTAKELLSHPATLSRPEHLLDFAPGNGGFSNKNGKPWSLDRKNTVQALKNVGLGKELWNNIIQADILNVVDRITASNGKATDVYTLLFRSSLCSMVALLMGRPFVNSWTNDELLKLHETVKLGKKHFQNLAVVCIFPWLKKFLIKFNIGNFAERMELINMVSCMVREEIVDRLKSGDEEDVTDFIMQYVRTVKKQNGCETIDDASVECLVGNIAAYGLASDSPAVATLWMLYLMAANTQTQAKVHAEIDDVIGRDVSISWEDRRKLPYTMACILEMQRWVTPVPLFLPRWVSETFEFHGYTIPRGTVILPNGWKLHRDPKYWQQPDDYMPERFLKSKVHELSKLEGYAPFSFGKRNCPGETVAMMITYLSFTAIIQKFQVRTPTGEPPDLTPEFALTFDPKIQDLCFIERQ